MKTNKDLADGIIFFFAIREMGGDDRYFLSHYINITEAPSPASSASPSVSVASSKSTQISSDTPTAQIPSQNGSIAASSALPDSSHGRLSAAGQAGIGVGGGLVIIAILAIMFW